MSTSVGVAPMATAVPLGGEPARWPDAGYGGASVPQWQPPQQHHYYR